MSPLCVCRLINVTDPDGGRKMMDEKCLHGNYVTQIAEERKAPRETECVCVHLWWSDRGGESLCGSYWCREEGREEEWGKCSACVFSSMCVSMSFYDDRTNDLLCHAWPWETSVDLGLRRAPGGLSVAVLGAACLSLSTPPTSQTAGSSASPTGQVPLNPRRALIWRTEEGGLRGLWEL